MLVYSTRLFVDDNSGSDVNVIKSALRWVEKKVGVNLSFEKITHGYFEKFNNYIFEFSSSYPAVDKYPRFTQISLNHPDNVVSNRLWIVEMGINQPSKSKKIEVTVVVKVDDKSPYITVPINVKQPRIVDYLRQSCGLSARTIGGNIKLLTKSDVKYFKKKVFSKRRKHCIVLVSPISDGQYMADYELLQRLLLGIADVYVLLSNSDAFAFSNTFGKQMSAWDGALNVIFPTKEGEILNRLYLAKAIVDMHRRGVSIVDVVFSFVVRFSNPIIMEYHVTKYQIENMIYQQSFPNDGTPLHLNALAHEDDTHELLQLVETENAELRKELSDMAQLISFKEEELQSWQSTCSSLKYNLENMSVMTSTKPEIAIKCLASLKDVADYVETNMSDRIVLNGSKKSFIDCGFKDVSKALTAFDILYNQFYRMFTGDISIDDVRDVLLKNGIDYNPFLDDRSKYEKFYNGRLADMNKHLKIGKSRNPLYLLRVHFEFDSDEQKIVIHHAGRHLPTTMS